MDALLNGRVLSEAGWKDGHAVLIEDGRIQSLIPDENIPREAIRRDLGGHLLLPGFIDIQVNGGNGFLFNDVNAGVVVSAGHTDALYSEIKVALDHGLTGFTHLFNAMSPLTSREPGAVGAALEDDRSWCGIIVDGQHVNPAVLRIALRCKPANKFMLVTDAMPSVGMQCKTFDLQGRSISVQNGVCIDPKGTLAGSDLDMASAVRNTVSYLGVDLQQAVRMASGNPAEFMGLGAQLGKIAPGYRANLVLANEELQVIETWIDGCSEEVL